MVEEQKLWEKEPNEPDKWFDRLTRFRLLGPARSLIAVYRAEPKPKASRRRAFRQGQKGHEKARKGKRSGIPGAWTRAAKDWRWLQRAEAWDAAQRHVDEEAWKARREEWRSREWNLGEKAALKITDLLNQDIDKGSINPQDVKYLCDALEKSSKVVRLALGLVTERQAHEIENDPDAQDRFADRVRAIVDRLAASADESRRSDPGTSSQPAGG